MRYTKYLVFILLLIADVSHSQWRLDQSRDSSKDTSGVFSPDLVIQSAVGLGGFASGFFLGGGTRFLNGNGSAGWTITGPLLGSIGVLTVAIIQDDPSVKPISVITSFALSFLGCMGGVIIDDALFGRIAPARTAAISTLFSVGLGMVGLHLPFPDRMN
jgi:hypothetical protein